ncbi:trypsin-like serine protease [Ramicandelaber brevisporus]|nr:trypsin-like serine protease [Ramicandelaber brevisporus]
MTRVSLFGLAGAFMLASCGTASAADTSVSPRIVGVKPVAVGEVPFGVNIRTHIYDNGTLIKIDNGCTGVILTKDYVIALASCLYNRIYLFDKNLSVYMPSSKLTVLANIIQPDDLRLREGISTDLKNPVAVDVDKAFIPPQFFPKDATAASNITEEDIKPDFNIAVLKLKTPLQFNATIQPIPIYPEAVDKIDAGKKLNLAAGIGYKIVLLPNGTVTSVKSHAWARTVVSVGSKELCAAYNVTIKPENPLFCANPVPEDGAPVDTQCFLDHGSPVYGLADAQNNKSSALLGLQYPPLDGKCSKGVPYNVLGLYHFREYIANVTGLKMSDIIYSPNATSPSQSGSNAGNSSGDAKSTASPGDSKSTTSSGNNAIGANVGVFSALTVALVSLIAAF